MEVSEGNELRGLPAPCDSDIFPSHKLWLAETAGKRKLNHVRGELGVSRQNRPFVLGVRVAETVDHSQI